MAEPDPNAPRRPDDPGTTGLVAKVVEVFNAHAVRTGLAGLALAVAGRAADAPAFYPVVLVLVMAAPYVALAPWAGAVADRVPAARVGRWCLATQAAGAIAAAGALSAGSLSGAALGLVLVAAPGAFLSPSVLTELRAPHGPDPTGPRSPSGQRPGLAVSLGFYHPATVMAAIAGAFAGVGGAGPLAGGATDLEPKAAAFIALGTVALLASATAAWPRRWRRQPVYPAGTREDRRAGRCAPDPWPGGSDGETRHPDRPDARSLRLATAGLACYWMILAGAGVALFGAGAPLPVTLAEGKLLWILAGLSIGGAMVSRLSRRGNELGMVPVGGAGIALGLAGAAGLPEGWPAATALCGFAFSAPFFYAPLAAYLLESSPVYAMGFRAAVSNRVSALAVTAGVVSVAALVHAGVGTRGLLLALVLPAVAAAALSARVLPRSAVRFIVLTLFRLVYRVRGTGQDSIPSSGGALLLPNHLSYLDSLVVSAACPRAVRFVVFDHYYSVAWLRPFLNLFGVVPISPTRAKDAVRTVAAALADGELVCLFPEGQLTRTGCLNEIKPGFELMLRRAGAPGVPVYIDGLWGSITSFERGRFFTKWPYRIPFGVDVHFGRPVPAREATAARVRERLSALSAQALARRPSLDEPLDRALARSLLRAPWRTAAVGYTGRRNALSRALVLATARALAERWRDSIPGGQVAVLLPESSPGLIVYLALVLAGKIPVAVPFENRPGRTAMSDAFARLGITTMVTSAKFTELLPDHYFPDDLRDFTEEFAALRNGGIARKVFGLYFAPPSIPPGDKAPDARRAASAYLYPEGDGLAVAELSGRQVLAQFAQLSATNLHRKGDVLLARASYASAAGQIFGIYYPLLRGVTTLYPPPSETRDHARFAAAEQVTLVVDDGPRLPLDPHQPRVHLRATSGRAPHHPPPPGAILTHAPAGIVLSVSQANPSTPTRTAQPQEGGRPGTFGRLLPGFAATSELAERGCHLHLDGPAAPDGGIALPLALDPAGFLIPLPLPPAPTPADRGAAPTEHLLE